MIIVNRQKWHAYDFFISYWEAVIYGGKIKERREALNLSQAELGRLAGVSQPTIASLEKGNQQTARRLPQIALALGLKLDEIDSEHGGLSINPLIEAEVAVLAFEVMVQSLREDLTLEGRKDLGVIFLKLAHEHLAGNTDDERAEQMRRRLVHLLIETKIQ